MKTKRLAAGHDLVAGVASMIEIRSGEAGSWIHEGYEGLECEYEIGADKAAIARRGRKHWIVEFAFQLQFQLFQVRRPRPVTW